MTCLEGGRYFVRHLEKPRTRSKRRRSTNEFRPRRPRPQCHGRFSGDRRQVRAAWRRCASHEICGAGHYSSTFSAAELFAALYYAHLRLNPPNRKWPDRDRFILSKAMRPSASTPFFADLGYFESEMLDSYTRLGIRSATIRT